MGVNDALTATQNIETALETIQACMEVWDGQVAGLITGIPEGATPVWGVNATAITTTSAVAIIADPAASVRLYITGLVITNVTAAELPTILIADTEDTPNKMLYVNTSDQSVTSGSGGTVVIKLPQPMKVAATATGITGEALSTVGDVWVTAFGYTISEA